MTITKAIDRLWYWLHIAENNDWVQNKVAWALYQTWKEADKE